VGVEQALQEMLPVRGWFSAAEAREIYRRALEGLRVSPAIVEIGSFYGRSTVVLGTAAKDYGAGRVYAVDPHDPEFGLTLGGRGVSFDEFQKNIRAAGLEGVVRPVVAKSRDAAIPEKAGLVFIDGDHSYAGVSEDYRIALGWLAQGGYISFHDYSANDPDVVRFVDELLAANRAERVSLAGALMTVRPPYEN